MARRRNGSPEKREGDRLVGKDDFRVAVGASSSFTGDGASRKEVPTPNPPLSAVQEALVARLSEAQVAAIDEALMSHATPRWGKVAMIVLLAMDGLPSRVRGIPDVYYAQRLQKLVAGGQLEAQGNLEYMRFSEVRLPQRQLASES